MRRKGTIACAAVLAACAGKAFAQPVLDGSKVGDESFYGAPLWVNTNPTTFGDNDPANVPPSGDPENAIFGVELAIPLSAIGSSTGESITLAGWINSGDHSFASNQVIGGLPNVGNLGNNADLDFGAIDGTQAITFTPGTAGSAPVVDGELDTSIYGAPLFLQNNFTGFGNGTSGDCPGGGGSEIDGVYAVVNDDILYLMITGNLENNNNALELFFDTVSGGENEISGTPSGVDDGLEGGALETIAGATLEPGVMADYYLTVSGENIAGDGDPVDFEIEAYLAELGTSNSFFLGAEEDYCGDGVLMGGDGGAPVTGLAINNSNVVGVNDSPSIEIPSEDFAVGSEMDALYAFVDEDDGSEMGTLYVLLAGNMESNFNKLNFFFDVQPGGQSPLRGDNVDISFNGLNRMGEGGAGGDNPGLTFDEGVEPDIWINYNTGSIPIQEFSDSALLRTDGPKKNGIGNPLDYGCFDGGDKIPDGVVICFDGPNIDVQDGFAANIFSNYAPRISNEALETAIKKDPFDPPVEDFVVPNLIKGTIDNSNIRGVTDEDGTGGEEVDTGVELQLDLAELGWDGESPIRIAGHISSGDFGFVSNQVIGGLPEGTGNLEEVTLVNFADIAGDQFVEVPVGEDCFADCNDDGTLNVLDFTCFQGEFTDGNLAKADCNDDGVLNILDFTCFQSAFQAGCP